MNGAAMQTKTTEQADIHGGMNRLCSRLAAIEVQLDGIMDRLVSRPESPNSMSQKGEVVAPMYPVTECLKGAHLRASAIEQAIASLSQLIG